MATLYELTEQYKALYEMVENGDIDETTFKDTLDAMDFKIELENKADNCFKVIKNLTTDSEALEKEIKRLQGRKEVIDNNAKDIKDRLFNAMKTTGKLKFKTLLFSFNIQKNAPSLKIDDENKVPLDYLVPQPSKIDKKALKKAVAEGMKFDGISLVSSESLRIR